MTTMHFPYSIFCRLAIILFLAMGLTGCVNEDEYPDTAAGNFEALWRIMDEHYCFFDAKGVDWDEVHARYAPQMSDAMTRSQQFEVLCNMLAELRDGHVNLYAAFDVGRNWSWREDYPTNFSDTLSRRYLGTDYRIASGIYYRVLDDNIGYIRCATFANGFGEGNLDEIFSFLAPCNGLILDIRSNGGGQLTAAEQLAARFTNKEITVGYFQHKTGRGHNDFSTLQTQKLKPSQGMRWQKPVVVLTNRSVFSAANEFVKYMRCCPHVTVVGDHTGGGAGMPFSSELPCGWSVRFSACPTFDIDHQSTEDGIAPDHQVSITDAEMARGLDTIIEYARQLLR